METLGSTTIICSDKTGTLTKNEMTVKALFDGRHAFEVTGSGYDPEGEILHDWEPTDMESLKGLHNLLRIGMLCNESSVYENDDGHYAVDGDPTEGALIIAAMKAGFNPEGENGLPRIDIIPFESERGFMATLP